MKDLIGTLNHLDTAQQKFLGVIDEDIRMNPNYNEEDKDLVDNYIFHVYSNLKSVLGVLPNSGISPAYYLSNFLSPFFNEAFHQLRDSEHPVDTLHNLSLLFYNQFVSLAGSGTIEINGLRSELARLNLSNPKEKAVEFKHLDNFLQKVYNVSLEKNNEKIIEEIEEHVKEFGSKGDFFSQSIALYLKSVKPGLEKISKHRDSELVQILNSSLKKTLHYASEEFDSLANLISIYSEEDMTPNIKYLTKNLKKMDSMWHDALISKGRAPQRLTEKLLYGIELALITLSLRETTYDTLNSLPIIYTNKRMSVDEKKLRMNYSNLSTMLFFDDFISHDINKKSVNKKRKKGELEGKKWMHRELERIIWQPWSSDVIVENLKESGLVINDKVNQEINGFLENYALASKDIHHLKMMHKEAGKLYRKHTGESFLVYDIETSSFRVYPKYNYKTSPRQIEGYTATHTLKITTENISLMGDIIDAATKAGANSVGNVDFTLSKERQEELRFSILDDAGEDARQKAEAVAKGLGIKVGEPIEVNVDVQYSPYRYGGFAEGASLAAGAPTEIQPGDLDFTVNIQVTYAIK